MPIDHNVLWFKQAELGFYKDIPLHSNYFSTDTQPKAIRDFEQTIGWSGKKSSKHEIAGKSSEDH